MSSLDHWFEHDLAEAIQPLSQVMRRMALAWKSGKRADEVGDLANLITSLSQLRKVADELPGALAGPLSTAERFDVRMYLDDHFDRDFRSACAAMNLPVDGQYPRYLVYPLRIQIDSRRSGVLINRKLHRGLRISRILDAIQAERSKLLGRPLNAKAFLADLGAEYDRLIELESAKNQVQMAGHEVTLRRLYSRLVPMRQWRVDYPEAFFAFDLHRLLQSGETAIADGRRLHLAPDRTARNNLAVIDASGRKVQLGLIAFR